MAKENILGLIKKLLTGDNGKLTLFKARDNYIFTIVGDMLEISRTIFLMVKAFMFGLMDHST